MYLIQQQMIVLFVMLVVIVQLGRGVDNYGKAYNHNNRCDSLEVRVHLQRRFGNDRDDGIDV